MFDNTLVPSIFDGFFGMKQKDYNRMKTDVVEHEDSYELLMNLPGFEKEDINASVQDGILTIRAEQKKETEEKDKKGRIIRQERYSGTYQRSFQVGDIETDQVKAEFTNGVLKLIVPKGKEEIPEVKRIAITG